MQAEPGLQGNVAFWSDIASITVVPCSPKNIFLLSGMWQLSLSSRIKNYRALVYLIVFGYHIFVVVASLVPSKKWLPWAIGSALHNIC